MPRFYSIRPSSPDFSTCSGLFGHGLTANDCYAAATTLPRGTVQQNTYTVGGTGDFAIPWSNQVGGCEVAIEIAGPSPASSINLPTNNLRPYINWVINQCVGDDGVGGFGTWGIEHTTDYINLVQDNPGAHRGRWPTSTSFITFSVRSPGRQKQPGNYDPTIAWAILQTSNARAKANAGRFVGLNEDPWFYAYSRMLANTNSGGPRTTWWNAMMEPIGRDEMSYACDAKLGTPSEVDCAKLEYSELGPSTDAIMLSPETPKVVTSSSCSVAIESSTSISITWGQIAAALGTLVSVCMTLGAIGVGGTAVWEQASVQIQAEAQALAQALAQAMFPPDTFTLAGRSDGSRSEISGLNALPPSVNVTLYQGGHFTPR